MKTLIMLRHGKSDWSGGQISDKDRPLNARGRRAAALMGAWLADEGLVPDDAMVSAAVRTRETWARLGPLLGTPLQPEFREELYLAEASVLRDAARQAQDAQCLLLIGHNPGIEIALRQFTSQASDVRMPTCAAAVLQFNVERWADIEFGLAKLAAFETPKSLV